MRTFLNGLLLAALGCNNLPSVGQCAAPGAGGAPPAAESVELVGASAGFDDLRYAASLGRVLAAPQGVGTLYLVDPDTKAVTPIGGLPPGIASLDAGDGFLFVAERGGGSILVVDPGTRQVVKTVSLGTTPDYVRFSPMTHEVWVTEPANGRIEILSFSRDNPAGTAHADYLGVAGPEGLAFDASHGRAYAHASSALQAIDVVHRQVLWTRSTGCFHSHGIPVVDEARGLVFAGCWSSGGGAVLRADDGTLLAGYEAGGGEATLGYNPALGHFYLRGDPGTQLAILAVCDDGGMALLGTAQAAQHGHGMAADDRGHIWVPDADNGRLLRFLDGYPAVH